MEPCTHTKYAIKHPIKTAKKIAKNKNVQKVACGAAIIGACGLVAVSGGSAAPVAAYLQSEMLNNCFSILLTGSTTNI